MKATKTQFSRWFMAGLRVSLLLVVATSLLSTTGCTWFRKKKTTGEEAVAQTEAYQTTPSEQMAPPMDNQPEGYRPGDLVAFPAGTVDTIYFDYDKSNIRADQLDQMEQNLRYLLDNPQTKVLIEGHCDERGTVEYNFSLGERRANSVRDYLIQGGVASERIAVISKGEEEPDAPGHSEQAWAQNRRCEFMQMF